MKRKLELEPLSCREVPPQLDLRITAYASRRCRERKAARFRFWTGTAAAAAALAVAAGTLFWMGEEPEKRPSLQRAELLAMGDFSRLEQTSYNVSFSLSSGQELNLLN